MANTNKTKAEILQELESIKGLLLEEDDIPILQDTEIIPEEPTGKSAYTSHESVLPGQGSLFDESVTQIAAPANDASNPLAKTFPAPPDSETKRQGLTSHLNASTPQYSRPQPKATGENPFLPQHIRERLHGNNPPPLFEYEAAKKIINATKNAPPQFSKPRKHLVDGVIKSLMPQIESELRHRLFAMSVEELEKILNDNED
jgi:hypothetical protein